MGASFGKYELIQKLASGGMGEVFLARGPESKEPLVLKRVLPHLSENREFLDLFLDEARIAARLNHLNIARILELGDVEGAWYLVMEYVAGRDLRQVVQALKNRRRTVPLGLACRIVADAAAGLAYAHRAVDAAGRPMEIVHRDVSPHNVLLSFDGAVKLIDFGVAKAAGRLQETAPGMLRGKYPYMSPEQATSGELDHRSDQFSLAVVLWELISGKRLFKAANDAQTLERVAACIVKPPTRKDEGLPPVLVELVMRALELEPKNRWPDMNAFRLAVEEALAIQQWDGSNAELASFLDALFPGGPDAALDPEDDPNRTRSSGSTRSKATASAKPAHAVLREDMISGLWDSLRGHEQHALAQLALFEAPFTLEAAEAVIDVSGFLGAPWVLDIVQALKGRNLIGVEELAGELRFKLPLPTRHWALPRLGALGPDLEHAARGRYAAWLAASKR